MLDVTVHYTTMIDLHEVASALFYTPDIIIAMHNLIATDSSMEWYGTPLQGVITKLLVIEWATSLLHSKP